MIISCPETKHNCDWSFSIILLHFCVEMLSAPPIFLDNCDPTNRHIFALERRVVWQVCFSPSTALSSFFVIILLLGKHNICPLHNVQRSYFSCCRYERGKWHILTVSFQNCAMYPYMISDISQKKKTWIRLNQCEKFIHHTKLLLFILQHFSLYIVISWLYFYFSLRLFFKNPTPLDFLHLCFPKTCMPLCVSTFEQLEMWISQ